jgi:adenine-specific DNA-methyltransferase
MSASLDAGASATPAAAGALPARLPLTSADPLAPRYEQLKALFPMAVTDGRPDLEKLRALMGGHAATGPERYGLSWAGKSDALKALRQLTTATLLPAPSESEKWETTGNAIIEGDNLEVLKVLQHAYHGKVKLIYIDPPYNTGGDFIYPDDYAEGLASYQLFTRQVNEEGHKLTTNVNTSGRFHSRWLTMIYPRLFLARNLLREDGVIFVSIDDHEVHNLRLVMDEIYGEENFVANVVWEKKFAPQNDARFFSDNHDHILVYARSKGSWPRNLLPRSEKTNQRFLNPDNDTRGPWASGDLLRMEHRDNSVYPVTSPTGKIWVPEAGTSWRHPPEEMAMLIENNEVWFGADGNAKPRRKKFLNEVRQGVVPETLWRHDECGHNQEGTQTFKALFEGAGVDFNNPKPVRLIRRMLEIGTNNRSGDLILDFFAGSGTIAQAVIELNNEDGGNRKFILVQLPEPTGGKDFPTIAEITKERVRRVIQRMEKEKAGELALTGSAPPDLGFKVFKLAPSNFGVWDPALAATDPDKLAEQWQLTADNVRADVQEQALLHELMLKCGLPLASRVEPATAAGTPVYRLDEGKLVICIARELTREALRAMIELKPQSVLCLDVGFKGNDALKVNAQLEFQSHGIQFRTA